MSTLIEFLPIVAFFVAYKLYDFYVASGVLMAATVLQMAVLYKMHGRLSALQKTTLVLILAFGSMTLLFHDERFVKWKPTVMYTIVALILAVGLWVFKTNFLQRMMGSKLPLPAHAWRRLCQSFIVFSLFMAGLNAWVATYLTTDAYMNFKLWGFAIPIVYFLGFGIYASRHLQDEPAADNAALAPPAGSPGSPTETKEHQP